MKPSLKKKKNVNFFLTMATVNAKLILNAVAEKLRNVLAALKK